MASVARILSLRSSLARHGFLGLKINTASDYRNTSDQSLILSTNLKSNSGATDGENLVHASVQIGTSHWCQNPSFNNSTISYIPFWPCQTFQSVRFSSHVSVNLYVKDGTIRFCMEETDGKMPEGCKPLKEKMKRMPYRDKRNELRVYRMKAREKLKSLDPKVRIEYKLAKAKRKQAWLIEKLSKFQRYPKPLSQVKDPESLTDEDRYYLKKLGKRKSNYILIGIRGITGGVIENMHLHWLRHEIVHILCKPCRPGQVYEYAEELCRLSGGIVIDIAKDNRILFYRGKNYVRPEVIIPRTVSKSQALMEYRYKQSLEFTQRYIALCEKQLEEYLKHAALYGSVGKHTAKRKRRKRGVTAELKLIHNHANRHPDINEKENTKQSFQLLNLDIKSDNVLSISEAEPAFVSHSHNNETVTQLKKLENILDFKSDDEN